MAKRRNPKQTSVVAIVEVEQPASSVEVQAQAAPDAVEEDQTSAEPSSELPTIAEVSLPEPSAAALDAVAAAPAITTEETLAVAPPTETAHAVALDALQADATISETAAVAETTAPVELAAE